MASLSITDSERKHIGEALIVYIYRALNKPKESSYFHMKLIDVLIKSVKDSWKLSLGIKWANGTSSIKTFDRRCNLDEHPYAPAWVAEMVFSRGESFAFLSDDALKRIKSMSRQKRRQLEAIAADLFPDCEAIRGKGKLFSAAKVVPVEQAYLTPEEKRHIDRDEVSLAIKNTDSTLKKLEDALNDAFSDLSLSEDDRDILQREYEDLLLGRLELEQPQINTEFLSRILMRCLTKLGEWSASGIIGSVAQNAAAALAVMLPFQL